MARKPAVLDGLNIVVRDMDAAVEFYQRLGIGVQDTLPQWRPHHRTLKLEGGLDADLDSQAFAQRWNSGWAAARTGVVLGFRLESREEVDSVYEELTAAGHRGMQEPYDAFWGARYAIVEDPSGNAVGLMSPVDPGRVGPPPGPPA